MQSSACYLCTDQLGIGAAATDCPVYSGTGDAIHLQQRRVCQQCMEVLASIDQYVQEGQLQFSHHQFKSLLLEGLPVCSLQQVKTHMSLLSLPTLAERGRRNSENTIIGIKAFRSSEENGNSVPPYSMALLYEIKKKRLLNLHHLPKNLQYLMYRCFHPVKQVKKQILVVPAQERQYKVKNALLFLMERISLSLDELPEMTLLVNFLLCHMDQHKVCAVLVELSHLQVTMPEGVSWRAIIEPSWSQGQVRPIVVRVDHLWSRIEGLLKLRNDGELAAMAIAKFTYIDSRLKSRQYARRVGQIVKSFKNSKTTQDCRQKLPMLYSLKAQRNSYQLIMTQVMEDQQWSARRFSLMQTRFKKQKEEYINKIVRLNNRIEQLQLELQETKFGKKDGPSINIDQQLVSLEEQSPDNSTKQPINEEALIHLQTILTMTDLFAFAGRFSERQQRECIVDDYDELTRNIIEQIRNIQQLCERMYARNRTNEQENNRLLCIIARKEDRLLSVIMEKDITIERYENGLWRMENGLKVVQEPLAHRIRYIMQIWGGRNECEQQPKSKKKKHTLCFNEGPSPQTIKPQKDKCQIY